MVRGGSVWYPGEGSWKTLCQVPNAINATDRSSVLALGSWETLHAPSLCAPISVACSMGSTNFAKASHHHHHRPGQGSLCVSHAVGHCDRSHRDSERERERERDAQFVCCALCFPFDARLQCNRIINPDTWVPFSQSAVGLSVMVCRSACFGSICWPCLGRRWRWRWRLFSVCSSLCVGVSREFPLVIVSFLIMGNFDFVPKSK